MRGLQRKSCALGALILLNPVVCAIWSQTAQQSRTPQEGAKLSPVALAAPLFKRLLLVQSRGGLLELPQGSSRFQDFASHFGAYQPMDVAADHFGQDDLIFVTLFGQFYKDRTSSELWYFSVRSGQDSSLPLPSGGLFAGIAADGPAKFVYVANSKSGEIHRIQITEKGPGTPKFFVAVRNAEALGALAVDSRRQRLYAADEIGGRIFVVDLKTKKVRTFAESVGVPSALAVDRSVRRLYVADAAGRRIWVLNLDATTSKPKVFVKHREFREPRGIAVDAHSRVWVGDYTANAVYSFAASGKFIQKLE